jgi:hypothetical protein
MNFAAYMHGVEEAKRVIREVKPGCGVTHPNFYYRDDADGYRSYCAGREGELALNGYYTSAFGVLVNRKESREELKNYHRKQCNVFYPDEWYYDKY